MHFLLKPPEKKSGKKLYFASSLKETDGKPNILSSDLTEYVERINILISSLKIAKLIHSPSDAAAAGDAAATEA